MGERQKRESENLTLQKQKAAQANSDGNGEQTKAVDMETRESRSEEKTEPRSEERKSDAQPHVPAGLPMGLPLRTPGRWAPPVHPSQLWLPIPPSPEARGQDLRQHHRDRRHSISN